MGNAGSVTSGVNGIEVGSTGQAEGGSENVVISNNTIQGVFATTGRFNGIKCTASGEGVVISGNIIEGADALIFDCIDVDASASDVSDVSDIVIASNVLRGSYDSGITVGLSDPTTGQEGRLSITGNVISNFGEYGISVAGASSPDTIAENVTISGNSLWSDVTTVASGIYAVSINKFCISGNTVNFGDTAANNGDGIQVLRSTFGSIVGNTVFNSKTGAGAHGIQTYTGPTFECTDVHVSANFVVVDTAGDAIGLGDTCHASANYALNEGAGGTIETDGIGATSTTAGGVGDLNRDARGP
jgi:hypothetical protein